MPSKPPSRCRCGRRVKKNSKCEACLAAHYRRDDANRGNSNSRGYERRGGHQTFRDGVLWMCRGGCVIEGCGNIATVADHYPMSRRELVAAGLDPNDPIYGRGLCTFHHNQHTGQTEGAGNLHRDRG